jgi:L-malate glycosyltransferase
VRGPEVGPVVHVSTQRTWRGGEQQLLYLHERLAARGVPQLVVCAAGSAMERVARARSLRHVPARRRGGVDPLFAWAVAREVRAAGARIVHAHDPHAHAAAVLAAALFGAPGAVVVSRRVVFPVGRGALTRWKYRHASVRRFLCGSSAVAATLDGVVDGARVRVVHDAIDPDRFGAAVRTGRLRAEQQVPPGVPLIGTVAALSAEKDPHTFVATAARLVAEGRDARFVLVGEGPLRAEVEAHARRRGLEGRFAVTGFRPDLPQLLPDLDVFLFTSAQEGLGTSILDAQVCGVPVVATAAGGIPEAVLDGVTGLLAPVGDSAALAAAVVRVLDDAALRERLVLAAARRVRSSFTAARMAELTLAVYAEALAGGAE